MAWVATAIVGSAAIGGIASAYSANKAASQQETAANQSAAIQQQQLDYTQAVNTQNQTNLTPYIQGTGATQQPLTSYMSGTNPLQTNLQPYENLGTSAAITLNQELPSLTTPITMDEATLQNTPGYQFNLTQGLKAVQNSAAARGLGTSGAALKGAATFATGLADSTYQNQFSNAVTNQTNAYNRLIGAVQAGQGAAGTALNAGETAAGTFANSGVSAATGAATAGNQSAAIGTQGAANVGSNVVASGNAAAAGTNALGSAVQNGANTIGGYTIAKGLYGQGNAPVGSGSGSGSPIQYPTYAPGN